jgi:hypothetical protein
MCLLAATPIYGRKGRVENETVIFNTSYLFPISRRKKMLVVKISAFYSDTMYGDKVSIKLQKVNAYGPPFTEQGRKARILNRDIAPTIRKKLNKSRHKQQKAS